MEELNASLMDVPLIESEFQPARSRTWPLIASRIRDIAVVFLILSAMAFASFSQVRPAQAAGLSAMQVLISGSGTLVMQPGEEKTVMATFQNTGTSTWNKSGAGFVSIYTYNPKYRTSVFADDTWYQPTQPAVISEATVAPGGVGTIMFTLHAPSTKGSYQETFYLASENTAWIPGGQFTFNITVGSATATTSTTSTAPKTTTTTTTTTPTPTTTTVSAPASTDGYAATVLIKSAKSLTSSGGGLLSYTVGVKNSGTKTWQTRKVKLPGVGMAASDSDYKHSSWVDGSTLVAKADAEVAPGSLDLISFQFSAPRTAGSHTVKFVLEADGVTVPGGDILIPVEVTSNAPNVYNQPKTTTPDSVDADDLIDEPMLRVGVLIIDDEVDNKVDLTCETDFKVRDGNENLLAEMDAGDEIEVFYKKGKYWFNRGLGLESTSYWIRVIPDDENAVCTVTNFDRRVTRDTSYPDNTFRNILEVRYNETKDRTWLINELPMEYYLRGLAETSNVSHQEFQKALLTVARTYALYHYERGTKRGAEFFHVTAYADDQVYNGYGQEERSPRLTESVEATEGVVVTYDGETALTPYFSRSDGRTRSWSEVWYGDVEWLQSVSVPCDKGKTLWGHGVGMSASGALCMANDGKDWKSIIEYFYKGVDLTRRW